MARPCTICCDPRKSKLAAEMVAAGASDQAIADRIGGISRVSVLRHRRNHIARPMQNCLALVTKGAGPRHEREQLAAAVASGTPTPQEFADAVLGLRAQAEKLQRIEARLERMAEIAEKSGSPNGVAVVVSQQLRGVEVGAKLAGVGGYAPQKTPGTGAAAAFSLTINLPEGHSATITAPGTIIEGSAEPEAPMVIQGAAVPADDAGAVGEGF